MNINQLILIEKFKSYYSDIFEEELIKEIIEIGNFNKIEKGELLIDVGDNLTHIPLILEGIVKIVRHEKKGEEFALYYLQRGNTCAISFINCIESKKSVFKGIVETDMEAVFVPVDKIEGWLIKYKSWRRFIIDSYHFRLMEVLESVDSLVFMKMNERLLKYLRDKVKRSKNKVLEITHQEIANDLNTSRVVISRIIKQLHEEAKIDSSRNKIKVLDF